MADHDEEAPLPLLMVLLLAGDAEVRPVVQTLAEVGLLDAVAEFDLEDREQKDTLAAGLRRVLEDLSADGPEVLSRRVAAALGMSRDADEVAALSAQLHPAREAVFLFTLDYLEELELEEPGIAGRPPFVGSLPDSEDEPGVDYLFVDPETTGGQTRLIAWDGHADPLIVALLDGLAVASAGDDYSESGQGLSLTQELFTAFGDEWNASCLSCHAVTEASGKRRLIWSSPERSVGFAKFDHRSHVVRAGEGQGENSCVACHVLAEGTELTAGVLGGGTGLQPVMQGSCLDCHNQALPAGGIGGASCTVCHVYHVDRPRLGRLRGLTE